MLQKEVQPQRTPYALLSLSILEIFTILIVGNQPPQEATACVLSLNILKKGPLHMVIETQHALLSPNILKKRPVDILESRHQGEESLNIVVSQQHSQNEQNSPRRIQMLFLVFQQCTVQFFCIFKDIL